MLERLSCLRIQTFPNIHDFDHVSLVSAYLYVCLRGTTLHLCVTYQTNTMWNISADGLQFQITLIITFFPLIEPDTVQDLVVYILKGGGDEGGDGGGGG